MRDIDVDTPPQYLRSRLVVEACMVAPPAGYQESHWCVTSIALKALAANEDQTVTVPASRELKQHARRNALLAPWPQIRSICRIIQCSTDLIERVADVP